MSKSKNIIGRGISCQKSWRF